MSISILLKRSTPGSPASIKKHIQRGERLAEMIDNQFSISNPMQWQVKHLVWALKQLKQQNSSITVYDYWRTIRLICFSLGKWNFWEHDLKNPKSNSKKKGGRPPLLPNINQL